VIGEVKSAVRVLEVLKYFDSIQREASVTEVARALGYPVSSTSVLLPRVVGLALGDRGLYFNPRPASADDVRALLETA